MRIACHEKNQRTPVIELADSTLRALCRPVRALGIFAPARWREWNLEDIAGFWVGRPRIFPPQFWLFEYNTAYFTQWLVLCSYSWYRFIDMYFGHVLII